MSKVYFTITGAAHYYGMDFFEKNMVVTLRKDKENEVDQEAIAVYVKGLVMWPIVLIPYLVKV